jgi:uncharacterized protein DUF6941
LDQDLGPGGLSAPYVDFLILADRVEVVQGKLYLMGGAWDRYTLGSPNALARFGVAVAVSVPWTRTNEPHRLELRIDDADGQTVTPILPFDFQVGRPPSLPHGAEQRLVWAVNGDWRLSASGPYAVVAALDGADQRRTVFQLLVRDQAAAASPPQS